MWSHVAAAQPSSEVWSLTALKAQTVPAVWLLEGSDFVHYKPTDGDGFVEIQGRLGITPGSRFEPVLLSEIRIRSASALAGERARSAFTVGSRIAMCRYLSPDLRGREVSKMTVDDERNITVSRTSPSAPLKFSAEGTNIDLCIAFPRSGRAADSLVLEFAGQVFPVALAERPQPGNTARPDAERGGAFGDALSRRNVVIAAICLVLLLLGAAGLWWWRRRRLAMEAPALQASVDYPTGATPVPTSSPAAGEISLSPAGAVSEGQGTAVVPPRRVAAEHCRTTFSRVGANVGPGKADFEAGLRLLQGERFAEAEARLGEAIGKGLPPTFECGAWSLRGQAAINQGHIPQAIDYFLNALGGREVTSQAALPAAMHLEVIYRALGLTADADKMRAVAKVINGFDIGVEPAAEKRLQEATRTYAKALHTAEPSALRRILGRFFGR